MPTSPAPAEPQTASPPSRRAGRFPVQLTTGSAALCFAGLALLFYAPALLGLRSFPDGDFTHHFLPISLFQQRELLAGRLPVWNPYTYGGHPFLADVQAAVFYPLSNLVLGLSLPWTAPGARLYFLEVEAAVHLAFAGFFTFLFVRDLTENRFAALLAGILFGFSGYLTGYPPVQLAVLRTAVWLPLILWLLSRAFAAPARWRWWLGAGAALAVAFLAGHSQTFLFLIYLTAAWTVTVFVLRIRSTLPADRSRLVGKVGLGLLAAGALALGLSAAQLLPSVEFAVLSVRANVDYAFVSGGFPLQDTWQLLLPAVLTQYSPLYIGVIGLGLAWIGTSCAFTLEAPAGDAYGRWRPGSRVGAAFFLGATAVALLLSYGSNGFLYPLFYQFAPGWNLFRGQERAAYVVAFGLSVLAGYGAAILTTMPPRRRAWLATFFAAIAIGATYLFGLLWQLPGRTAVSEGQFLLGAAITILLASVFAIMLRLPGWSRRRSVWLALLIAANLFWVNAATNVGPFSPDRKTILPPEVEALQAALASTSGANPAPPGRVYNEYRVYEDYGMRAGAEDVWGASPLRLARYALLFDQFPLDRMWRLLGVEHVLTWRKELFGPSKVLGEWPQATDTTYLHRLGEINPRAWLATTVRQATDDDALKLLGDHQFDLDNTALAPPDNVEAEAPAVGAPPPAGATIDLKQLAPGQFKIKVTSSQDAVLVVAENWMPGWRIENARCGDPAQACVVEGRSVSGLPLLEPARVDLTLVGIPIPAGTVEFALDYQPDSVRLGLWLSGCTLLVLALVTGWRWFTTRRHSL